MFKCYPSPLTLVMETPEKTENTVPSPSTALPQAVFGKY